MTSTTSAVEVNAEAKRILAMSISKLYASRSQRGGLRLHRSLLLSLVMRTTRDIYHSACMLACSESEGQGAAVEPMDTTSSAAGSPVSSAPEAKTLSLSQPQPPSASVDKPTEKHQDSATSRRDMCDGEITEDKENLNPVAVSPARHSRKRRGKVSAAPDFLPSKRARLEPGEERHSVPLYCGSAGIGNCRVGESLTTLSLNQVITAF